MQEKTQNQYYHYCDWNTIIQENTLNCHKAMIAF